MDVPFIPNITACMKMTSFSGVVKNNLTLKTKSQYIIDRFEIEKRLREPIAKNIPQHQQFVESLAKLLEPIRISSSVVKFAVIRSLVLMGLQNCSRFISGCRLCQWPQVSCIKASGGFPG